LYGEVETRISAIVDKQFKNGITPAAELFVDVFNTFTEKTAQGLKMGFPCLDLLTGGLKKSDMIILAARPSMGKTALAMNIAANVAKKNSVLVFSLEMNKQQLGERWFSTDSGVKASRIQHRELKDQDIDALLSSVDRLGSLKLFVDDTMGITLPEIKMKSRRVKREHGLDLIVIDYLQLMQSSKRYKGDRVQEVSELSRGIKGLARDLDVPVLALSQLSRGVEYRADKRPMLSDLRESGSIEQDADIVMFIYRDDYYDRESEKQGLAEVIVAKNRNGATGAVGLQFDKARLKFTEPTRPDY
ncbi:MAG: replicative DNA helicase, partial [Selenomonadaceae bacterium]|nr:replicative DNA helicase [Selenomonadaceae bacterium]